MKKVIHKEIDLTPLHSAVIRLAQYDIDIVSEPFAQMVKELDTDYETFFNILSELQEAGIMRRFASILNHRKAGFNANAMVVWDIDEAKGEEIGESAAAFSAVSHCYLRPKYENWPLIFLLWFTEKLLKRQMASLKIWLRKFLIYHICLFTHQESSKR